MARGRKKRRYGRGNPMIRRVVGYVFKGVGTVVSLTTVIKGVTKNGLSDPTQIPRDVSYEVTGFDPSNPTSWDWTKAATTVGAVVSGLLIMKLGSYIARKW